MSLSVEALLKVAQQRCGGGGSQFDELFIAAVNRVSDDALSFLDLSVDDITSTSGEIGIHAKYRPMYEEGAVYHLWKTGEWGKKPDDSQERSYRRAIGNAQALAAEDADSEVGVPDGGYGE
jgi:hypothetical protein